MRSSNPHRGRMSLACASFLLYVLLASPLQAQPVFTDDATVDFIGVSDTFIVPDGAAVGVPPGIADRGWGSNQADPYAMPNNDDGDQSVDDEAAVTVVPIVSNIFDLALTYDESNRAPFVGEKVKMTVTITNQSGNAAGAPIEATINTLAGLMVDTGSIMADIGTFDPTTRIWHLDSGIAPGASINLMFLAEVRTETVIESCAEITLDSGDDTDSTPGNWLSTGVQEDDNDCALIMPIPQASFWANANHDAGTVCALSSDDDTWLPGSLGADYLFAGSDGGGVYRSKDNGANWFPTALTNQNVRALGLDNRDATAHKLYAGTYGSGVFATSDLGSTFGATAGQPASTLVLSMANDNTANAENGGASGDVWVGTDGGGVFFSNDDGATWTSIVDGDMDGTETVRSLAIEDAGGGGTNFIFAGTQGQGVFVRTGSAAAPWDQVNGTAPDELGNLAVHALISVPGIGGGGAARLFAGTNDGVWYTDDKGATWTQSTGTAGTGVSALGTHTPMGGSQEIHAGTDGHHSYKSTDDGVSFTQVTATAKTVCALHSAVDGRLYAGGMSEGVWRYNDGPMTFDQVSNLVLNAVIQALNFSPNGNRIYGGTFGFGVIMSDDPTTGSHLDWVKVNNGLDNLMIYALASYRNTLSSTDYIFAGTWNNGVYRSTSDGEMWNFSGLPDRIVYDLDHCNDGTKDILYAATDRGEVARSVDNALTWLQVGVASTAIWAIGVLPGSDCNTLFAGTFGAGIFTSTDGGYTWTPTDLRTGYVFDFAVNDQGGGSYRLFAATSDGLQYTDDGGQNWSHLSTGLTVRDVRSVAVLPTGTPTEPVLLAGTWGGGAFYYNWNVSAFVRDGLPGMPIQLFAVNPVAGEVFAATNDGGLYRKRFNTASVSTEDPPEATLPSDYSLMQNYPNPFNPVTTIGFTLPQAEDVRLAVYDLLGREVARLVEGVVAAGEHTVSFDAANLPSGAYYYRLETGATSVVKTMVLFK